MLMTIRSSHLLEQGPGETGHKPVQLWKLVGMTANIFFPDDFSSARTSGSPSACRSFAANHHVVWRRDADLTVPAAPE